MQNFARVVGPEAAKAIAIAAPGIMGAIAAEPLILAAVAGGLLIAAGVALGAGISFAAARSN